MGVRERNLEVGTRIREHEYKRVVGERWRKMINKKKTENGEGIEYTFKMRRKRKMTMIKIIANITAMIEN